MKTALLIMAYGGPDSLDDVEPYLLDVRGGRATSHEIIEEVRERYRQIGGRSPILEQTREQGDAIQRSLDAMSGGIRVYVGMRHWHPFIPDVVAQMKRDGIEAIVGLVMAPHYSDMSIGAYERKLKGAADGIPVAMVKSWGLLPPYVDAITANVRTALQQTGPDARVLLTAHSLPERILSVGDPYRDELLATVDAVRERLPGITIDFAFQSAAMTSEPWLGPDAGDVLREWADAGVQRVVVCAIGFVTEHVEILYDLDIELQNTATETGVKLVRASMVGADAVTMGALAALVHTTAAQEGWIK